MWGVQDFSHNLKKNRYNYLWQYNLYIFDKDDVEIVKCLLTSWVALIDEKSFKLIIITSILSSKLVWYNKLGLGNQHFSNSLSLKLSKAII